MLVVQSAANLSIILRYKDSAATATGKSKPYGVQYLQLFYALGEAPVGGPTATGTTVHCTKSPIVVQFATGAGGQQAYFWARWVTRTGLYSPWSGVINFTVPIAS